MKNYPLMGVIGGAGVAAGIEFLSRLEQKLTAQGAYRDFQHPEILYYQATQVPSRSLYLENEGPSFVPGYIDAGLKLKNAGADFLCMSCNTAHYAIDELEQQIGLPFVNIIEETIHHIALLYPKAKKIGIMSSNGTRKAKLYETYFARLMPECVIESLDDVCQEMVTLGICNIKKGYHRQLSIAEDQSPYYLFIQVAKKLINKGVDMIVLGCTEIPLVMREDLLLSVPLVNTIDVLADACLKKYQEIKVAK